MGEGRFVELIQMALIHMGLQVTQVHGPTEAGRDLELHLPGDAGLCIVEVKKYSSQTRVSVDQVAQLLRTIEATGATSGLLIATTDFTSSARALASANSEKLKFLPFPEFLTLKDQEALMKYWQADR